MHAGSDFSDTSQSFTFKISLGISIGTMGVILLIVIFILTSLLVFVLKAKLKVQHQLSLAAQNPVYEELESQIVNPPAASISIEKNSAYIKTSSVA